jgi:hypothetical protein
VTRTGKKGKEHKLLVRRAEGKRALERPRRKQNNNIKIGLIETGCGDLK